MYIIFCIPYVKWVKFYPYFSNEETATEADLSKLSKVLRQLVAECGADPGQTELCVRPPNHHTPPMLTHLLPLTPFSSVGTEKEPFGKLIGERKLCS